MKTLPIAYAKLPRGGLGNKLLVWAKAQSFSELNKLPLFVSNWAEIKIGPFIRNEKSKRQYWGYFNNKYHLSFLKKISLITKKCIEDPPLLPIDNEKLIYVFKKIPLWPNYFNELYAYRTKIIEKFYSIINIKYLELAQNQIPPVIGVHVRRSDFEDSVKGDLRGNACNKRTSIEYFVGIIKAIRDIHGLELPVTVFTDGRVSEIKKLLALPGIKISNNNPDIVDLILLARSQYIVVSPGSTFSNWAGFISNAPIITHSSSLARIRSINEEFFEGTVSNYEAFYNKSRHKKKND